MDARAQHDGKPGIDIIKYGTPLNGRELDSFFLFGPMATSLLDLSHIFSPL